MILFPIWYPFSGAEMPSAEPAIPSGAGLRGSTASGSHSSPNYPSVCGEERNALVPFPSPTFQCADAWRRKQLRLRAQPVCLALTGLAVLFSSWSGLPDPWDHRSKSLTMALYTVRAFDWPSALSFISVPEAPSLRDVQRSPCSALAYPFCQHQQRGPAVGSF